MHPVVQAAAARETVTNGSMDLQQLQLTADQAARVERAASLLHTEL